MHLAKILPLLLFLTVGLAACKKEDKDFYHTKIVPACGVKHAARDLPWLQDRIEQAEVTSGPGQGCLESISVRTFRGQPIFYFYSPCASCLPCHLYNCSGNPVQLTTQEEIMDFFDTQPTERLLWQRN